MNWTIFFIIWDHFVRYVIQKLRNQELIEAELYETATVLFSDIPIFGTLVKECTPLILIKLLNEVYTAFDETLVKFDAYKVETINDSYLVRERTEIIFTLVLKISSFLP